LFVEAAAPAETASAKPVSGTSITTSGFAQLLRDGHRSFIAVVTGEPLHRVASDVKAVRDGLRNCSRSNQWCRSAALSSANGMRQCKGLEPRFSLNRGSRHWGGSQINGLLQSVDLLRITCGRVTGGTFHVGRILNRRVETEHIRGGGGIRDPDAKSGA
jgi:hypothetical protein